MNAWRISRPSAVRTGTFWRFGFSLEMRPVVVSVCLNVAVDAAVVPDERRERVGVGAAQLLDLAVAQQVLDDRVLLDHLLERVGVGGRPGLRLLHRAEPELLEEHLPQLRRRVHVELLAGVGVDPPDELVAALGELGAQALEELTVDLDAGILHPAEHADERPLDVVRRGR